MLTGGLKNETAIKHGLMAFWVPRPKWGNVETLIKDLKSYFWRQIQAAREVRRDPRGKEWEEG